MSVYLLMRDAVNGKCGSVFLTVDGKRHELAGVQKLSAHDKVSKSTFTTVGTVTEQTKITGVSGTGTLSIHYYANCIFGKLIQAFRKTGVWKEFQLMVVNEDAGTSVGKQSVVFEGCILTGDIPISKLDAHGNDPLLMDFTFSYQNWYALDEFNLPSAVGRE